MICAHFSRIWEETQLEFALDRYWTVLRMQKEPETHAWWMSCLASGNRDHYIQVDADAEAGAQQPPDDGAAGGGLSTIQEEKALNADVDEGRPVSRSPSQAVRRQKQFELMFLDCGRWHRDVRQNDAAAAGGGTLVSGNSGVGGMSGGVSKRLTFTSIAAAKRAAAKWRVFTGNAQKTLLERGGLQNDGYGTISRWPNSAASAAVAPRGLVAGRQ